MFGNGTRASRRTLALAALGLALLATGCGGICYPVTGRVLLDGEPLEGKEGAVVLKPDAGKGNKSRVSSMGVLEKDGTYTVVTNGRPGAPAGWYKVIVSAAESGTNPNDDSPPLLNARYMTEATTPLAIEIVASPGSGSYDLQLSP